MQKNQSKRQFQSISILGKNKTPPWYIKIITGLVWLFLAGYCTYWALKWVRSPTHFAQTIPMHPVGSIDETALFNAFGARSSEPNEMTTTHVDSGQYTLSGIILEDTDDSRHNRRNMGLALIASANEPARPYAIGSHVSPQWVVKSIQKTSVVLAESVQSADGLRLELPQRIAPNRRGSAVANLDLGNNANMGLMIPTNNANPVVIVPTQQSLGLNMQQTQGNVQGQQQPIQNNQLNQIAPVVMAKAQIFNRQPTRDLQTNPSGADMKNANVIPVPVEMAQPQGF